MLGFKGGKRTAAQFSFPLFLSLLAACGDDASAVDAGNDAGNDAPAHDAADAGAEGDYCSLGSSVFDESVVHTMNFELTPEDWAAMIREAENSPEYGGPDKTYFNATMEYDGVALASPVAIRLKGHYSLVSADGHSFPLKLDFDRVDEGQDLEGLTKVNLHPNQQGVSTLREYLSYGAIREHGVPTARVGFVRIRVNGEDLGLYSIVEHVKGKFIRCHYDAPFGDLYKPEEPVGNLGWLGATIDDYQPLIQFKWPDTSVTNHASILNLLEVVNMRPISEFEGVLDVEGVLTYLALNVGLGNYDYYATFGHNYYFYEATPGRFTMFPWDMNLSQTPIESPCGNGRNTEEWPVSNKLLADEATVAQYLSILQRFLRGPGSVEALGVRIDAALGVLGGDIDAAALAELRTDIQTRVESQLAAIDAGISQCPVEGGDACTACLFEQCEGPTTMCEENEGCACYWECLDDEEEAVCLAECELGETPPAYEALISCVVDQCSASCGL